MLEIVKKEFAIKQEIDKISELKNSELEPIKKKQKEINDKYSNLKDLEKQATEYKDTINQLINQSDFVESEEYADFKFTVVKNKRLKINNELKLLKYLINSKMKNLFEIKFNEKQILELINAGIKIDADIAEEETILTHRLVNTNE